MTEELNRNSLTGVKNLGEWYSKLAYSLFFSLALAGCGPAISPSHQRYAGPPFTFADLQAHTDQHQGQLVVLGGEVMAVQPHGNASLLTVNQIPLDAEERPIKSASPCGTFVVESDRWLNPEEYAAGSKVTVIGLVKSRLNNSPLLEARQIHLWGIPFYKPPLLVPPFDKGS